MSIIVIWQPCWNEFNFVGGDVKQMVCALIILSFFVMSCRSEEKGSQEHFQSNQTPSRASNPWRRWYALCYPRNVWTMWPQVCTVYDGHVPSLDHVNCSIQCGSEEIIKENIQNKASIWNTALHSHHIIWVFFLLLFKNVLFCFRIDSICTSKYIYCVIVYCCIIIF